MLEVAGSVADFYALVRRVEGLEFLADEETEFEPDADFFEIDTRKDTKGRPRKDRLVGGRLYLAMPDLRALREILGMWDRWQKGMDLGHGRTPWRDLFARLRLMRPWGAVDRLTDDAIAFWREEVAASPGRMRRIEAELWFRERPADRRAARLAVERAVAARGGEIVHHAERPEIGYHAFLIDLPSSEVERLATREEIHLAICDEVMFLRPQSSARPSPSGKEADAGFAGAPELPSDLPPVAALLDGVPVQKHEFLDGRIEVDDPDGLEAMSVVGEREHGTAMASLILHGDAYLPGPPISRKLHLRPVLHAPGSGQREQFPRDRLLVDVIYRAIRRMKEGDAGGPATAPEVFLVNLSLGDAVRPFTGPSSPLARLLDYLADRYGILFLVSAGNILAPLPLRGMDDWAAFENAPPEARKQAVLTALSEHKVHRTLLSPAEALNVLTVGAWHDEARVRPPGATAIDPFEDGNLPNPSSALGLGHRKVIKPDICLPGGRELVTFHSWGKPLSIRPSGVGYGLGVASPDATGRLDRIRRFDGTSVATALATRSAHRLFEALTDAASSAPHADMDPEFRPVVIKALLVHRSRWGDNRSLLADLYGPQGQGKHVERRDNIARLLGYGFPRIEEALSCAPNRATLVGYGTIRARTANIHRIPLPPALERVTEWRALAITVAWLSPINRRHRAYRRAKLEVGTVTETGIAAGVERSPGQPVAVSSSRGTVVHSRYEGKKAVRFVDGGNVLLRIVCKEQAGSLDEPIRYGVAVTLEAGQSIPIYREVRARLAALVGARVPERTRTNGAADRP